MNETVKALLAKVWKDEELDLSPGTHFIDEVLVVRVVGNVEKQEDQFVTPTVSVPLISVLALFWEKAGIAQDEAMALLREAITEAMNEETEKDAEIKSRIDNVSEAIAAVRKDLLAKLPKMERAGRTITKGLQISVSSLSAAEAAA